MKTCKKCKIEKNETEFHPCKKSKSGYQARCKICLNLARKESKNKNREEYLKKAREYAKREYDKNPIKFIERHKEWKKKNPEKLKEYARKAAKNQRINSPHKVKARLLVSYAVEIGLLIKPKICSNCLKECKPEGHHADYSKPLEVVWLCKECHTKEHRK